MKKRLMRREFVTRIGLATIATAAVGACNTPGQAPKEGTGTIASTDSNFTDELTKNRQMPRDLVIKLLDQKVDQYMKRSHHCAQSSFMALKEQFGLEGDQVFKALTPLPGIAERGETCGAISGPLMALGLIYGRDIHHMDDWETYQESLKPAGTFCNSFEQEFGTTLCHDIQEVKFGKCYRLTDPGELEEFQKAGATEHCSSVVRIAVRIAAEIIMDDASIS